MNTSNKRYAVIITAYNEEKHIQRCLDAIETQTIKPKLVLVVDDGSKDATPEILSRNNVYVKRINAPKLEYPFLNRARAFKSALTIATHIKTWDFLLKVDADIEIESCYAERLMDMLEGKPSRGIASGVFYKPRGIAQNGAIMYRRRCLERLEVLPVYGWDRQLLLQAQKNGWDVIADTKARYLEYRPCDKRSVREYYFTGYMRFQEGQGLWTTLRSAVPLARKSVLGAAIMLFTHALNNMLRSDSDRLGVLQTRRERLVSADDPGNKITYGRMGAKQKYGNYLRKILETPVLYLFSFIPNGRLQDGEVVAIMCVWDEQDNVSMAIESTKDFVSRYIVVDKNGDTVPVIRDVQNRWGLDVEYHVRPELTLREARLFAASRVTEPWILIQDGDEVIDHANELRKYMKYPNTFFKSRKNVLIKDSYHTQPLNNGYHNFLYHNNGNLKPHRKSRPDIPDYKGRPIYLSEVIRTNLSGLKSPKRLFYYHMYWVKYQTSGLVSRYPTIEDYVKRHLKEDVTDEEIQTWYSEYVRSAIPYDPTVQGPKPEVLVHA